MKLRLIMAISALLLSVFAAITASAGDDGVLSRGTLQPKSVDVTKHIEKKAPLAVPGSIAACSSQLFNPPGRKINFSEDGVSSFHFFQGQKEVVPIKIAPPTKSSTTEKPKSPSEMGGAAASGVGVNPVAGSGVPIPGPGSAGKAPTNEPVGVMSGSKEASMPDATIASSQSNLQNFLWTGIYRINFRDFKGQILRSGYFPQIDSFLVSGNSPKGAVLLAVDPAHSACGAGDAILYHSKFASNIRQLVSKKGKYAVIDSGPGLPYLWDMTFNQAVTVESGSFQLRKILFPFPKQMRPLAVNQGDQGVFLWKQGDKGGLHGLAFTRRHDSLAQKIGFEAGDRVIQDGRFFGALKINEKENTMTIIEIKQWSGRETQQEFTIKIPANFRASEATGRVNFKNRKMIVLAGTEHLRRRWRKAFIYDYEKSPTPLAEINVGKESYVSEAEFHPSGLHVLANAQNTKDETKNSVYIYSFSLKKAQTIPL